MLTLITFYQVLNFQHTLAGYIKQKKKDKTLYLTKEVEFDLNLEIRIEKKTCTYQFSPKLVATQTHSFYIILAIIYRIYLQ